jgi:hypothetical protein
MSVTVSPPGYFVAVFLLLPDGKRWLKDTTPGKESTYLELDRQSLIEVDQRTVMEAHDAAKREYPPELKDPPYLACPTQDAPTIAEPPTTSTPKPEDVGETPPPTTATPKPESEEENRYIAGSVEEPTPPPEVVGKANRRGRRKGVNYVSNALTEVTARLKDVRPVDIPSIARTVGCTPENLYQSERFMKGYKVLTEGMRRAVRGWKVDGTVEACLDSDEDEANF